MDRKHEILIEGITQDIIKFLIEDRDLDIESAMNIFYNSWIFEKLYDIETGLYLEGSAYVYEVMLDHPSMRFDTPRSTYNIVAITEESTVVTDYVPLYRTVVEYQSEADLEREFIKLLSEQGYEYLHIAGHNR